jgi:hypothetical protein
LVSQENEEKTVRYLINAEELKKARELASKNLPENDEKSSE